MKLCIIKYSLTPLIILFITVSGCVPYYTTEKAFVVIYNKTHHDIKYTAYLSKRWLSIETIKAGAAEFFLDYESESLNDPLPADFSKLKLILPKCTVILDRHELVNRFIRDPDGRNGWNLYINTKLLSKYDCKSN